MNEKRFDSPSLWINSYIIQPIPAKETKESVYQTYVFKDLEYLLKINGSNKIDAIIDGLKKSIKCLYPYHLVHGKNISDLLNNLEKYKNSVSEKSLPKLSEHITEALGLISCAVDKKVSHSSRPYQLNVPVFFVPVFVPIGYPQLQHTPTVPQNTHRTPNTPQFVPKNIPSQSPPKKKTLSSPPGFENTLPRRNSLADLDSLYSPDLSKQTNKIPTNLSESSLDTICQGLQDLKREFSGNPQSPNFGPVKSDFTKQQFVLQ